MISSDYFAAQYPHRVVTWQLREDLLTFGEIPKLMGIVNVTPDSFSDGGAFLDANQAVEHGLRLASEGAAILDVGGESTRPNAEPVSESEELRRVVRVVQQLAEQTDTPISIDTSKAKVASEAIAAGAQIINDVTGLEGDPDMIHVAASSQAGVCAMHMRGTPQTMQQAENLAYPDVVADVHKYLELRLEFLLAAGIQQERICLDPGIGFAKTTEHNLKLLSCVGQFHNLGAALLVGHSRKGFLAKITQGTNRSPTAATIGVSLALAAKGVQILRVHDVQEARDALLTFVAAGGIENKSEIGP